MTDSADKGALVLVFERTQCVLLLVVDAPDLFLIDSRYHQRVRDAVRAVRARTDVANGWHEVIMPADPVRLSEHGLAGPSFRLRCDAHEASFRDVLSGVHHLQEDVAGLTTDADSQDQFAQRLRSLRLAAITNLHFGAWAAEAATAAIPGAEPLLEAAQRTIDLVRHVVDRT